MFHMIEVVAACVQHPLQESMNGTSKLSSMTELTIFPCIIHNNIIGHMCMEIIFLQVLNWLKF
jgi:hypothetical protein